MRKRRTQDIMFTIDRTTTGYLKHSKELRKNQRKGKKGETNL